MSTARYRAFIAVAQQGSLSAAARALGVSQPTISSQIATLERQSQIELFHRQGYRMTLSQAGHQLMTLVQKLLALESETEFFLRDSGQLNQGELKIGAVGPFHVIEMVAAYSTRHPGMKLSIRMGNSQQVLHDLENYTTDVAVLAGLYERPELLVREYARHAIILFAHVDHPLARREQVDIEELNGLPLLLREQGRREASYSARNRQPRSHTRGRGPRPGHWCRVRSRVHCRPSLQTRAHFWQPGQHHNLCLLHERAQRELAGGLISQGHSKQ